MKLRNAATGLLLTGLLVMAFPRCWAQQQQTPPARALPPYIAAQKPAAEDEQASAEKPNQPGHEGIKVHGHWMIDVKNHDGSLASHTEFDNSLVTPNAADMVLAEVLTSQEVMGGFAIGVDSATPGALCPSSVTASSIPANSCYLVLTTSTSTNLVARYFCTDFICFPGMSANYLPPSYAGAGLPLNPAYMQLQGSFSAPAAGPITGVHTYIANCATNYGAVTTTEDCTSNLSIHGNGFYAFTATTLTTPINIVAGQYVTVTVKISFS